LFTEKAPSTSSTDRALPSDAPLAPLDDDGARLHAAELATEDTLMARGPSGRGGGRRAHGDDGVQGVSGTGLRATGGLRGFTRGGAARGGGGGPLRRGIGQCASVFRATKLSAVACGGCGGLILLQMAQNDTGCIR